jgi:ribosome biogenesis GTPase
MPDGTDTLIDFGWDGSFESEFLSGGNDGRMPARVIAQFRDRYRLMTARGELDGIVSGRFQHTVGDASEFPVVGDWVACEPIANEPRAVIHARLQRRTKFSRRAPGTVEAEQILAANLDAAFVVTSLNRDYSPERIERFVTLLWETGAMPVVVLTKLDLCPDAALITEVRERMSGVDIHAVCALDGRGLDGLKPYLKRGRTVALLGSSGTGKSTLVNALAGKEVMHTSPIREDDDEGRHTTTHRQMILLPGGGLVVDTPGLREVQLWDAGAGLAQTFEDIEALMLQCRFSDCRHKAEPGCQIRAALESGTLHAERYEHYLKLQREAAYHERQVNARAASQLKDRWKKMHKQHRQHQKFLQKHDRL